MSETPRTDEEIEYLEQNYETLEQRIAGFILFTRKLERDLQQANAAIRDAASYMAWDTFDQKDWETKHRPAIERAGSMTEEEER